MTDPDAGTYHDRNVSCYLSMLRLPARVIQLSFHRPRQMCDERVCVWGGSVGVSVTAGTRESQGHSRQDGCPRGRVKMVTLFTNCPTQGLIYIYNLCRSTVPFPGRLPSVVSIHVCPVKLWRVFRSVPSSACRMDATLRAPLSGTFLQTVPDLVTPLSEPVWPSGKALGW